MDDQAAVAVARDRALETHAVKSARNPWGGMTEARVTYALKVVLLIVVSLYLGGIILGFLARIATVVYVLIGAVFFAYLIYPVVERLRRRMPLVVALLVVYAGIIALVSVLGWLVVPHIANDLAALVRNSPAIADRLTQFVNDPNNPVLAHVPEPVRAEAVKLPQETIAWGRTHGAEALSHAFAVLISTFAAVATFIIIPLLAAYLLMDVDRFRTGMLRLLPTSRWAVALSLLRDVDGVIGGFIRGQLIVAACIGVLLTVALLIMHVPYAFLLGLVAAIGDLVPYVGAVLTFIPAVLIATINNGFINGLIVAALFIGIYEVEGHLISPAIVSSQVKLSPLMVLLAVLVGAELGGIVGMLVAVPVAGALRVILVRFVVRPAQAPIPSGSNEKAP
ncbi:MAG TPA: AI-2E family transporter [Candidatus Baltobacteraceae bacterium]|nr:AI-2E family transporter [Candidatus Baltobacteraceae bacterium]